MARARHMNNSSSQGMRTGSPANTTHLSGGGGSNYNKKPTGKTHKPIVPSSAASSYISSSSSSASMGSLSLRTSTSNTVNSTTVNANYRAAFAMGKKPSVAPPPLPLDTWQKGP